ncbi:MAG: UDP-N-acetylmuramoyl-L-alanine--D-glutamate ligase [bacterium]|nr:UDP-N-acetylmuramoyl-L-alanine--D-glutamate ligase [bacterium]
MDYKKVLILGFAKSGYEAAKVLIKRNCKVIINDSKTIDKIDKEKYEELKNLGVEFVLGSHPDDLLDNSFSHLIKNPGVPIDHKYVLKAKELNIDVINEVELAYSLIPKDKNIKIIGITGTNGKTTTTTLIYEMLKKDQKPVLLAGNIGYPLCSILDKLKENDIIVMEVSSQQLENLHKFNPDVAVITNISEAHLEFFKTYDYYKYLKSKILINQQNNDICILNLNDSEIVKFSENAKSIKKWFSSKEKSNCYLEDDAIFYENEKIIAVKDIKLRGIHNYENIMAAIIAVKCFDCSTKSIVDVLENFNGVEHRLEFVREKDGVLFYNDTEATNIKCTQIALNAFNEPTIIILGGYERGQDFEELKPFMKNVKAIIGIGETRKRVEEFGKNNKIDTFIFETLKESFPKIKEIMRKNDVVLLSPASASWDQYNRCEERGDEFKKLVNEI